jgi:hypothetical protein
MDYCVKNLTPCLFNLNVITARCFHVHVFVEDGRLALQIETTVSSETLALVRI